MSAQASASGCCISTSNAAAPLLPVTPAFRLKASASPIESPESGPATNHNNNEKEQLLHRSLSAATTRR